MAVSYPINLPASPTSKVITISKRSVTGSGGPSPFTFSDQIQVWQGQRWQATVQLPAGDRGMLEPWVAALTSLNYKEGSFLLGDSANRLPRGVGVGAAAIVIGNSPAVANGGFETAGAGGVDVFANWVEAHAGSSFFDGASGVQHSGSGSANFNIDSGNSALSIYNPVLVVGHRYYYEFWARSQTGSPAGVNVLVTDNAGWSVLVPLTTTWTKYSGIFTANSTHFEFLGGLGVGVASSSFFVDDVLVYDLGVLGGLVNGASQTGYDLITDGWLASQTGILKAGDWLQLGTGTNARLYKVILDVDSNSSGQATLTLWPKLRTSPADNQAIIVSSPVGKFMLATEHEWSIDEAHIYGMSFSAMEDLRP